MNGLNNNCGRILYPLLQDEGGKFKYTNSNLNKEGEGGRLVRSPSLWGEGDSVHKSTVTPLTLSTLLQH
jgi:hypothetical protein